MLKYSIKLSDKNIKQETMVWSEKYLSPDLSFVSGVTSQNYHLEKYTNLAVSNNLSTTNNSVVNVTSKNVTRQGYLIIKNKEYDVVTEKMMDYTSSEPEHSYKYVFINGKYYYFNDGEFIIDKWLVEKYTDDGKPFITEEEIRVNSSSDTIEIDTIVWIEDGLVSIDGNEYFFEKDEKINPSTKYGLKYFEDGECLDVSAITKCNTIIYKPFSSISDYIKVTKFTLTKQDSNKYENFEQISYCSRYYYVPYKGEYYNVKQKFSGDSYYFVCEIPNQGDVVLRNLDNEEEEMTSENCLPYGIHDLNDLYKVGTYVVIEDSKVLVNHEVMNASEGREVLVYLEDSENTIISGDEIILSDEKETQTILELHENNEDTFIIYNNEKYNVINNLCDKVEINDNEYDIDYINGKQDGNNCVVSINNERVPMKISGNKLVRYGNIVSGDGKSASSTAEYDIHSYSGVTIDGKKYIVQGEASKFITLDKTNKFKFVVNEKIGNSLLICEPEFNAVDYDDDLRTSEVTKACKYVVEHQNSILIEAKDKIFGSEQITSKLALYNINNPISSDDYYNLLDNLDIYTRNGYISIPMSLTALQGNNIMQDELVKQLFEEEKKKAINPIIDMEKDVYYPKYIDNRTNDDDNKKYIGVNTVFNPIEEIRFNLHFRTRNLLSWKVNESYNDISVSGKDNWFVTDFHPYDKILSDTSTTEEYKMQLMESSDLLGLLWFTNEDVFYQKKKISKSFLRISFYDSTDPQTQNLLATSTIFMNGHKLFKTFIDNSRKNENNYGVVMSPTEDKGMVLNKISVNTEYLGSRTTTNTYISDFGGVIFDNDHRLGSEFVVSNKYETATSSEGFYLYMFKEYSENLHPKPIYMKVEFNHAGIGRTIPFIIPMAWSEADADGNKYPTSALTFNDLETLKKGIKLSDVYAQSYIPLYAVYDFKNKQYAYVFDDRYATVKTNEKDEHERVVLNLFELKVMDEQATTDAEREAIIYRKQETAKININDAFKDSI